MLTQGKIARIEALEQIKAVRDGIDTKRQVTLGEAWTDYRARLVRRIADGRQSDLTLVAYEDKMNRLLLPAWRDWPLRDLSDDAAGVAERHREITRAHGPYSANHAMRALRAVYRHARKTRLERGLPAELPTDAVQWNRETRRSTGMSQRELAGWHSQLRALPNPVRQEFHLFMLLSGSRPDALRRARWADLDVARRALHFPDPKGGAQRAFYMPLSRAMLQCLWRARRAGRFMHGHAARTYIFPADTPVGCIAETKERRTVLSKWGVDLRQTYRTAALACALGEMDVHILMNHSLGGVSAGYITPSAIMDHLRAQQEKVSAYLVSGLNVKN